MKVDRSPEQVRTWMHRLTGQGLSIWAVVDACGCMQTANRLEAMGGSDCVNLFDGDGLEAGALSAGPRLILLTRAALAEEAFTAFSSQPRDVPSIFFIATNWQRETFLRSLTRRIDVLMASGGTLILRWWDPRVWLALHDALDDATCTQFFSPVASDLLLDRNGIVRSHSRNQPSADTVASNLLISEFVEHALLEAGEPDAIMNIMREVYGPECLTPVSDEQRYSWCAEHIRLARQHQIQSPMEQAFACRIASQRGSDWWSSPYGKTILKLRTEARLSLFDAVLSSEEQVA